MEAREDIFTPIHKGLRSMIYGLAGRLQTHDFADLDATKVLVNDLEHDFAVARTAGCALCVLNRHAQDEETSIFPDAAKAGSDLVPALIQEHHELGRREIELARSAHALLSDGSAEGRRAAGVRLNQEANELFAAYLAHMNREETGLVPWMQAKFSDGQMAAMRGAIVSKVPPDRMFALLGWMLPSLNAQELSGFLRSVRPAMPPPAFQAVVDLCAARVDPTRWGAVKTSVGL